ncbi:MAG: hypothetical protein IJV01_03280 [Bacteroidales bacterium]|nr:hypothetical protein [Bacteroidales bacterium]
MRRFLLLILAMMPFFCVAPSVFAQGEAQLRVSSGPMFLDNSQAGINAGLIYESRFAKHFSWTASGTINYSNKKKKIYYGFDECRFQSFALRAGVRYCPFWNERHHLSLGLAMGPGVYNYVERTVQEYGAVTIITEPSWEKSVLDLEKGRWYFFDLGVCISYLYSVSPHLAVGVSIDGSYTYPGAACVSIAYCF